MSPRIDIRDQAHLDSLLDDEGNLPAGDYALPAGMVTLPGLGVGASVYGRRDGSSVVSPS